MREIKFRVWHDELGIMDYSGKLVTSYIFENVSIGDINYFFESTKFFKTMQYAGLLDKNGREIYEGDIVDYFQEENSKIVFKYGSFVVEGIKTGHRESLFNLNGLMEVIGNIYENTELLEVK